MSKLYEVEFTVTAVVLADDEAHAYKVARNEASEIFRDDPRDDIFVGRQIEYADQLPPSWDVECRPYGGKLGEDGIIGDYLGERPPERDTKTIDMFATSTAAPAATNTEKSRNQHE